jgi:hypothetical protein
MKGTKMTSQQIGEKITSALDDPRIFPPIVRDNTTLESVSYDLCTDETRMVARWRERQ